MHTIFTNWEQKSIIKGPKKRKLVISVFFQMVIKTGRDSYTK